MKIAIIGHGNVGATLAKGWADKGHKVVIGARNPADKKVQALVKQHANIKADGIPEAAGEAEVILVAVPAPAVSDVAKQLGTLHDKIIIDATNSVFEGPDGYKTGAEALKAITSCEHVVKGFNTTGYENMADPVYDGRRIDMFTAGDSQRGKETVDKLSRDLGFGNCYDFGGDDKFELIEQFAMCWINLAIMQGEGRDMAVKIMKR